MFEGIVGVGLGSEVWVRRIRKADLRRPEVVKVGNPPHC